MASAPLRFDEQRHAEQVGTAAGAQPAGDEGPVHGDAARAPSGRAAAAGIEERARLVLREIEPLWDAEWLASNLPADTISRDTRPGASPGAYWWHGDGEQVGAYWLGYQSTWLPASLLDAGSQESLAEAWFTASRHWSVAFHFNKGLAGATPEAIAASRDTATNPQMLSAFALAIIASSADPAYPGQPLPMKEDARARAGAIASAIRELHRVAPDAGTYVNECDFHQKNWRQAFWGSNAERLEAIKRRYDDQHLFTVHHGIGSV